MEDDCSAIDLVSRVCPKHNNDLGVTIVLHVDNFDCGYCNEYKCKGIHYHCYCLRCGVDWVLMI